MSQEQSPWTYTPTDNEMAYLNESLGSFFEDQWLTDILYKVRVGKEATCYCCRAHPDTHLGLIAAKVYRPRMFRAMRNDGYYRMGRTMVSPDGRAAYRGRVLRALQKHTRFGKRVETLSWCHHEFGLLQLLHERGADVPKPIVASESAILMEYIGDEAQAAPTLHMVSLEPDQARMLFDRLVENLRIMLREYVVHSDLSAHNVLWWDDQIRIIDMPQAVAADQHPGAFGLFTRDVDHICKYFIKQGVAVDPVALTVELWGELGRG